MSLLGARANSENAEALSLKIINVPRPSEQLPTGRQFGVGPIVQVQEVVPAVSLSTARGTSGMATDMQTDTEPRSLHVEIRSPIERQNAGGNHSHPLPSITDTLHSAARHSPGPPSNPPYRTNLCTPNLGNDSQNICLQTFSNESISPSNQCMLFFITIMHLLNIEIAERTQSPCPYPILPFHLRQYTLNPYNARDHWQSARHRTILFGIIFAPIVRRQWQCIRWQHVCSGPEWGQHSIPMFKVEIGQPLPSVAFRRRLPAAGTHIPLSPHTLPYHHVLTFP